MSEKDRQSQRRTILRNSPLPGGVGPTQTHLYMDGTKLMGQQYDGVAKTIIDFSTIPATTPVGSMTQYGGDAAPSGWLMCDGDHLNSVGTYADLFAVLGYVYGRTDSSGADDAAGTYFQVPDCRGRVSIHRDATGPFGIDTLGTKAGNNNASTLNHGHTVTLDSPNWGSGYLEAEQYRMPYIIDWTDLGTDSGAYSSGRDTYSGNDAWLATDYNFGAGPFTPAPSSHWGFSLYAPTVGDPDKNDTMKVVGTVEVENSGSGSGTGGNLQPFIVTNTIIRYA